MTAPLLLLGGASIKVAGDIQALEKGFAAVYKGASDVGEELKKVQEVAKLPGLGLKEAEQGSIRLQAVGISAEQARKTLLAFGNAIATTGGGKNELERVTVQLAQLSGKGKVLAQDLRPIIEAAPIAAEALKKLYGTVDSEAISASLAKAGKSSKDFISDVTDELAKLPKVSGGIKNALENLSDAGTLALAKLGDAVAKNIGLEDLAEKISAQVTHLADDFASLSPASQKVILGFAGVAAGAGPVLLALGTLGVAVPKVVEGFKLISGTGSLLVGALGPVGIAVAAVAAGLVYFAVTSKSAADEFQDAAKRVDDLDGKLNPLLKTYDELTAKSKLTTFEQQQLGTTIQQLGELLPAAVTEFDKYGKAIAISRGELVKLRDVQAQLAVTAALEAFPDANEKVSKAAKELKFYQDRLNQINKTGTFKSGAMVIAPGEEEKAALRKRQLELSAILEEALLKRNDMARRLGVQQQYTDDNNVVRNGTRAKSQQELEAAKAAAAARRKLSKENLEADIKDLNDKKDALDKDTEKDSIAAINIELAKKQALIKAIDELGVGSKSDAKKQAKELSDLAKANETFRDGIRQVNMEYQVQGETFDVGAAKARVYKTYLDKLVELDKTGQVEDSPKFKKAMEEYRLLTIASERFQETARLKGIFENTEASIAATGEQMLALGKYADETVERVKLLESQLSQSLQGIESLQKAGAEANDEFLLAERQHAKELTAELEKARAAAAAAKRDADTDDLLDSLNGGTGSKASQNFGDLFSGKAQSELEERIRKAQNAVRDIQKDGASAVLIKQAQDAVAGLKGQLDLTDVYAGAAQQAGDSLGEIASVILDGIGGIITGQMSLTDGLASIFGQTLQIVGNFMKDFGKQLLLLGAGHVALGLATANPAMVTAGGLELAAGGALYLGGAIVSALGSAATPSTSQSSTPQTSATPTPGSGTSSKDKQAVSITVNFAPVELRADGTQLRSVMRVDSYRLTNTR
ncbi:tape measure protein [Hymenobacter mellowenesis]|uniref:tape measure protein n=1 Tax=Hymenobacter mellowenesis TaxID=3063995 RepID=UPI00272C2B12|nr:tape measure protein [Hymenobacter sp. M29]